MPTKIGSRTWYRKPADQTVTASTTLVDAAGLSFTLGANKKVHVKIFCPFTLEAAGGYKFQLIVPAAPTFFQNSYIVTDGVTASPGAIIAATQTSSAAFANALAVAGTHQLACEFDFVNGANAGTVKLQFACNSAAGSIILLQGGYFDLIRF